jgi:EPS-associated MarR family transcriptional regulator
MGSNKNEKVPRKNCSSSEQLVIIIHSGNPAALSDITDPMSAATTNQSPEVSAQSSRQLPADVPPHSITGSEVYLRLLSLLEQNPAWTQRQLADALGVSLGKTNFCLRALRNKGLVKWGNFSQNANKLQYMHLLTPKGIAQKFLLTAHFLQRKENEFEGLRSEIARLRAELGQSNPNPVAAITAAPPGETSPLREGPLLDKAACGV